MKRIISLVLVSFIGTMGLCSCSSQKQADVQKKEVIVFVAASMTETMTEIAELYKAVEPDVELVFNFDSSGILKTQIEEGADCDIFISAAQKQMNQLDITSDANTDGLDFVDNETRFNLVSNAVVLITPLGNPAGVKSFEDVAADTVSLIALGNSDVPVGQYSEEIFTYMGIWDKLNDESKITFGTNVKEVLAQVAAGAVDCGIVYSTDAALEADVEVIASAPEGSHKEITYPAAVLKTGNNVAEAKKFIEYLETDDCTAVFEKAGFGVGI